MPRVLPMDVVWVVRAFAPLAFRGAARAFRRDCHAALRDLDYLRAMRVAPTPTALRHYFRPRGPHRGLGCAACVAVRHPVRFSCFLCHTVRRYVVRSPCWAATAEGVRCRRPTVGYERLCSVHVKRRPGPVLAAARWLVTAAARAPGAG